MALVPHKITALAESDADGTDGKNIIAGAVVSLFDSSGAAVTLFDDESGNNGSTAKQTDSSGQVVVWVTPGEYSESVNGSTQRAVTIGGRTVTSYPNTESLQNSRPTQTGQRAENRELANAQYELAASGYTALPGDIVAANGRVWMLILEGLVKPEMFGDVGTSDDSSVVIAAMSRGSVNLTRNYIVENIPLTGGESFTSSNKRGKLTLKQNTGGDSSIFDLSNASGEINFSDITFDGQAQSQPLSTDFIDLISSRVNGNFIRLNIDSCTFLNVHTKAVILQTDGIVRSELNITNSHFEWILEQPDFDWNPSFVDVSENYDLNVSGCTFKSGYDFSSDGAMAINHSSRLSANPVNEYASIRIQGNRFEGLGRKAAVSGNSLGCIELRLWTELTVISDNIFKDCYKTPIRGKSDCKELIISNNNILGGDGGIDILRGVSSGPIEGKFLVQGNIISGSTEGIVVAGGAADIHDNVLITDNVLEDIAGKGIRHVYGDQVSVTGNNIRNCGDVGIDVQNTTTCSIQGNVLRSTGGASGIAFINGGDVSVIGNHVVEATDVSIRIGSINDVVCSSNICSSRIDAGGGNNIDFRISGGNVALVKNNIGDNGAVFSFSKSGADGNSWQLP